MKFSIYELLKLSTRGCQKERSLRCGGGGKHSSWRVYREKTDLDAVLAGVTAARDAAVWHFEERRDGACHKVQLAEVHVYHVLQSTCHRRTCSHTAVAN